MSENSDYMKQFSAEQFRSWENVRGETYHLWLTELPKKCEFTLQECNMFYRDIADSYWHEKGLANDDFLSNYDHSTIAKRVEEALERLPLLEEQRKQDKQRRQKRSSNPFNFVRKLFRVLNKFLG